MKVYEIDDTTLARSEGAIVSTLATFEVMDVLIARLNDTNGIDFCSQEQLLALLNLIEQKAFEKPKAEKGVKSKLFNTRKL